jgi:DNA excision repair protein ERCC-2
MKAELHISVRDLVEYSLRRGDLDLTFFGSEHPVRAIRAHQAIQDSRPKEYAAEVSIRYELETDKYRLIVRGRIDGVYRCGGSVIIDEIKTTRKPLSTLQEQADTIHWGQAKCYAYIYALQNNMRSIGVQLTYFQTEENKTVEIRREFEFAELRDFFDSLLTEYLGWADKLHGWVELRSRSVERMRFPFSDYRPGQDKMIEEVASALEERNNLLIQAPTGIGKTMAVIFPAVQAMTSNTAAKIFFLTARTTGRNAAEQCLEILMQNGLAIKYLSLTAKEKLCFNPDRSCNGEDCIYARGYYDRINGALQDAFNTDSFTRDVVINFAEKHKVCPFEFSLELALWVDFIICDYNYVFDPRVYLRRFFDNEYGHHILLVDEAHNLVDRSREMYSATLHRRPILALRKNLRTALPIVYRSLGRLNSWLLKTQKEMPEDEATTAFQEYPEKLYRFLRKFTQDAEQWLARNEPSAFREDLLELYFDARRFLNTADRYDTDYATCYAKEDSDFSVKLFCIDPSKHLRLVLERSSAAIFFSATLTPTHYFTRLFGCSDGTRTLTLVSPFASEHLRVMIAGKISALYKHREFTKFEVARMISALIDQKKGNYLIFFPSYEYMRMIHTIFEKRRPRAQILVQNPKMSEQDRERFLKRFEEQVNSHLVGFAVMGGFFAESIDLVGERLTGAAVVGVGFPQLSLERELIRAHYDSIDGSGFAFAYQVPGMIKVLQAAGRVIRSENDRGVILLIDFRYSNPPYSMMLPEEWRPIFVGNVEDLISVLEDFWDQ